MTTYAVIRFGITDADAYRRYRELAGPTVKEHGGEVVLKGPTAQHLETPDPRDNHIVIAFDSHATAVAWYESNAYQQAISERRDAGEMSIALVDAPVPDTPTPAR